MLRQMYHHRFHLEVVPQGVTSSFSHLVVDHKGFPHLPLTEFFQRLQEEMSGGERTYLTNLLPYFTYLATDPRRQELGDQWDGPPDVIRRSVHDYLVHYLGCKVQRRRQQDDELVREQAGSAKTVRLFLTALKRFYTFAGEEDWIAYDDHPLQPDLAALFAQLSREARRALRPRPRMPQQSGVETPAEPPPFRRTRTSASYFMLLRGTWRPKSFQDPDLPQRLVAGARVAGLRLRDQVVLRLAYESGARISEVTGLTVGGWRHGSLCRQSATAFNKGSGRRLTKDLAFSAQTSKLLHRYVNGERRALDPSHRRLETLDDADPLFLTQRRTPYTRAAFMPHWYKLRRAAGVRLHVHGLRHWHVTQALLSIYKQSKTEAQLAERKERLVKYMGWQSAATLAAYDHAPSRERHVSEVLEPLFARWSHRTSGERVPSGEQDVGRGSRQAAEASADAPPDQPLPETPADTRPDALHGTRSDALPAWATSILGAPLPRDPLVRGDWPAPAALPPTHGGWGDLLPDEEEDDHDD